MKHFPLLQKKHSFIFAGFHSNKKKQFHLYGSTFTKAGSPVLKRQGKFANLTFKKRLFNWLRF